MLEPIQQPDVHHLVFKMPNVCLHIASESDGECVALGDECADVQHLRLLRRSPLQSKWRFLTYASSVRVGIDSHLSKFIKS